jgi:2-keto-4-pentenoate hydratase
MSAQQTLLDAAAEAVAAQRRTGARIPPLPGALRHGSVEQAYGVQDRLNARLAGAGFGEHAGYKIGCTTAVMQRMLDIPSPCYGAILAGGVHHTPARLSHASCLRPGIECEIAVQLGEDLPPREAPYDAEAVAARVEHCMAAIELVDDRYVDYRTIGVATLIADNFFHAGCILGAPRADWRALDLTSVGGRMLINGSERGRGKGGDVMGHPFAAVAWLANALIARDHRLRRGDVVLSGSVVETQWVERGEETLIEIDGLGGVSATFA